MRILATLATLTTLILLARDAAAQGGNPAGMEPGTPANHPNTQDRLFVQLIAAGGHAEVSMAALAESRARSSRVKEFARAMARDHSKANKRLAALIEDRIQAPDGPDPEHRATRARLARLSGAQFDLAYMRAQLVDHQKAIQLLEWEINGGQNAQLRRHASETLLTVMHHLEMAQAIVAELTRTAPQGLAASSVTRRPVKTSAQHGRPPSIVHR
jgi:putative membrane protein